MDDDDILAMLTDSVFPPDGIDDDIAFANDAAVGDHVGTDADVSNSGVGERGADAPSHLLATSPPFAHVGADQDHDSDLDVDDRANRVFLHAPRAGLVDEPASYAVSQLVTLLKRRFTQPLQGTANEMPTIHIAYGSDCSGAEAPWFALKSLSRVLEARGILKLRLTHAFSSEDTRAHAVHKFLFKNACADRIYNDLHSRGPVSGPTLWHDPSIKPHDVSGECPLPAHGIDIYVTGFECQDMSFANRDRDNRPLLLGPTGADHIGRSSATLRDSLEYCKNHSPRVIFIENVKGCPIDAVLNYVRSVLPAYQWCGHIGDGADFGSATVRGRMYLIGTLASCTLATSDEMIKCIAKCVRPREPCTSADIADTHFHLVTPTQSPITLHCHPIHRSTTATLPPTTYFNLQ